jgi:hypothetical protein
MGAQPVARGALGKLFAVLARRRRTRQVLLLLFLLVLLLHRRLLTVWILISLLACNLLVHCQRSTVSRADNWPTKSFLTRGHGRMLP